MTTYTPGPDFSLVDHGSIWLLTPNTPQANAWVADNIIIAEDSQWSGRALVIEPRFVPDIVEGFQQEGLTV